MDMHDCHIYAERFSFRKKCRRILEYKLGRPIRKGLQVLHTCDSKYGPCINEDHLYEGNAMQNARDRIANNIGTKLTVEDRKEIRRLIGTTHLTSRWRKWRIENGLPTVEELAKHFKVSEGTIRRVAKRTQDLPNLFR